MIDLISESNCSENSKRSADKISLNIPGSSKRTRIDSEDGENDEHNFNTIFPSEIKDHIFEFLQFRDLMAASLVCKKWSENINNNINISYKIIYKVSKDQQKEDSSETGELGPFIRRYVHFQIKDLPTVEVFNTKFTPIRLQVSSIRLIVNVRVEFTRIKSFLESFPNLKSLEIQQFRQSRERGVSLQEDSLTSLNLFKLENFGIEAKSGKFTAKALSLINAEKNKLKSLRLLAKTNPVDEGCALFFEKLGHLLNNQTTLKSLQIQIIPAYSSMFDRNVAVPLEPKFELENLILDSEIFGHENGFSNIENLVKTSINSCKVLKIKIGRSRLHFIDDIFNMTQLTELAIGDSNDLFHIDQQLLTKPMKCRLTKLEVRGRFGSGRIYMKNLLEHFQDSLETLILDDNISTGSPIWKAIATNMSKLKVLASKKLSKTTMTNLNGSSIEEFIIIKKTRTALNLVEDEAFLENYKAKNPNCKSVVINESF